MNKDQIDGRVKESGGKVKEVTGRVLGKPDMEIRGRVQKTAGHAQASYGDAKSNLKKENRK